MNVILVKCLYNNNTVIVINGNLYKYLQTFKFLIFHLKNNNRL